LCIFLIKENQIWKHS